jgi:hypothetical protein
MEAVSLDGAGFVVDNSDLLYAYKSTSHVACLGIIFSGSTQLQYHHMLVGCLPPPPPPWLYRIPLDIAAPCMLVF